MSFALTAQYLRPKRDSTKHIQYSKLDRDECITKFRRFSHLFLRLAHIRMIKPKNVVSV